MRRLFAIVLLVMLPFQFTWAAVASYCAHETEVAARHLGHHEHQHQANAHSLVEPIADTTASAHVDGDKAPGAMDLDCGQCHAFCGVMVTLPAALAGGPGTAPPVAKVDETVGAHAPSRPERPQWRPLA